MQQQNMFSEQMRLQTFSSWPSNVPVDPERIAKGGFYATGKDLEVECHWCKNRISQWNYGEQVMVMHRELDPLCPFVVNPIGSGNIPITSSSTTTETESSAADPESTSTMPRTTIVPVPVPELMNEQCRLATFKNWPVPYITPQSLAKAGFFYYNDSDRVCCVWCHGVIAKWEVGDNAFTEHAKFFPNCPRVELGPNIEIAEVAGNSISDIGIQQIRTPKREKYSCLASRVRTFERWPRGDIQSPEVLATAGFYYLDNDDQVRCFYCNGGLRSWQKEDDPWFEHAKWFPKCQFVELVKGAQYIAEVQGRTQRVTLDEAMATEPALKAMEMGLSEGRIRFVMKKYLEGTGKPYSNVESLVDALLDYQCDEGGEDDSEEHESSSTIVREVSRILDSIFNPGTSATSVLNGDSSPNEVSEPVQHIDRPTTRSVEEPCVSEQSNENVPDNSKRTKMESSSCVPKLEENVNGADAATSDYMSLEEEIRQLKDARLCKICMSDEVGVVFLPCAHLVTCVQCATGVSTCPLCRKSIKAFVRTFLS